MEDANRLIRPPEWREKKPDSTARLGDVLTGLLAGRIQPLSARLGPVMELWEQLLPEDLARHCRIEAVAGAELRVSAASPAYAHELRMCAPQLIEELQRLCPKANIRSIKVSLGQTRATDEE